MISILEECNNIFLNVHAEQVFSSMFIDNSTKAFESYKEDFVIEKKGIYQHTLSQITVQKMHDYIKDIDNKTIFMDFDYILDMANNVDIALNRIFINGIKNNNNFFIYNVNKGLFAKMVLENIPENLKKIDFTKGKQNFSILISKEEDCSLEECLEKQLESSKLFMTKLISMLMDCSKEHKKKSFSSRVILGKYINIKEIIHQREFFYYSIYNLANKLISYHILTRNYNSNKDKCLFLHTMNSSTIGAIIGQIFCMDLVFVDHLGPYNKLYNKEVKTILSKDRKYLVVSDVVCLGTELSNAKSILSFFNADYIGCISFVNILTLDSNRDDVISLFEITADDNVTDYTIETNFCKNCKKQGVITNER